MFVPQTGNQSYHENGIFLMSDSKTFLGDVFSQRIVPLSSDLTPREGSRNVFANAPSFEPEWINERCYVKVDYDGVSSEKISHQIRKTFKKTYHRKVIGGKLHVIFDDIDCVKSKILEIGGNFMYAESLYD
jgi:hypothetical protein